MTNAANEGSLVGCDSERVVPGWL